MITSHHSNELGQALSYFKSSLSHDDYYVKGKDEKTRQEISGKWVGDLAKSFGLHGEVTFEDYKALAENKYPSTHPLAGNRITPRNRPNRVLYHDFTHSPPKYISYLWAMTKNPDIETAAMRCAEKSVLRMQQHIKAYVRQNQKSTLRNTPGLAAALFGHRTARQSKNYAPDPQLHVHAVLMSYAFDEKEDRYKAACFDALYKQKSYFELAYHADLAYEMKKLGYDIEQSKTEKFKQWSIKGIQKSTVDKFSNRTKDIEKIIAEKEERKGKPLSDKDRSQIGARYRLGKTDDTLDELFPMWESRIDEKEKAAIDKAKGNPSKTISIEAVFDYAKEKAFENESVVTLTDFEKIALKHGLGHVSADQISEHIKNNESFIIENDKGVDKITLVDIYQQEQKTVDFVKKTKGKFNPLHPDAFQFTHDFYNEGQRNAILHAVRSTDQITGIVGLPGVGKTTAVQEITRLAIEGGSNVSLFAPNKDGVKSINEDAKDLTGKSKEAFLKADTFQKLALSDEMQDKQKNGLIIVDEAGLLSTPDMEKLFDIAKEQNARVILVGDPDQFSSVERGDAFEQLMQDADLSTSRISKIMRQTKEACLQVAELVSNKKTSEAFNQLDAMGAIIQKENIGELHNDVAKRYLNFTSQKHETGKRKDQHFSCIIQAPTHRECELVNHAIRQGLKARGRIEIEDRTFTRIKNLNVSTADKRLSKTYKPGMIVRFNQNSSSTNFGHCNMLNLVDGHIKIEKVPLDAEYKLGIGFTLEQTQQKRAAKLSELQIGMIPGKGPGFMHQGKMYKPKEQTKIVKGSTFKILGTDEHNLVWAQDTKTGQVRTLPTHKPKQFDIFEEKELKLAVGDEIRFTSNGKDINKKELANNAIMTVSGFDENGNIEALTTGGASRLIDKNHGVLTHGYTTTRGQGLTRDGVIIAQSSMSFRPGSQEQINVGLTRGRQMMEVYTDDKAGLLAAVTKTGNRMSASALVNKRIANDDSVPHKSYDDYKHEIIDRNKEKAWADEPEDKLLDFMIIKQALKDGIGKKNAVKLLETQQRQKAYARATVANAMRQLTSSGHAKLNVMHRLQAKLRNLITKGWQTAWNKPIFDKQPETPASAPANSNTTNTPNLATLSKQGNVNLPPGGKKEKPDLALFDANRRNKPAGLNPNQEKAINEAKKIGKKLSIRDRALGLGNDNPQTEQHKPKDRGKER